MESLHLNDCLLKKYFLTIIAYLLTHYDIIEFDFLARLGIHKGDDVIRYRCEVRTCALNLKP